ncbi:MAG: phosphoribosylglycinamide formyltransferase [Actinobacteria bacterium]|jgi:phosphoribosylglycinamide formyltransferase-1|nr:phosphoribosylglycinamide formyltransferase [Actinomycetota bacterium]
MGSRIVILISGTGSGMTAVLEACERGDLAADVVGVLADRPCRGLEVASEHGVPAAVTRLADFSTRHEWNQALTKKVRAYAPDLVLLAGFMRVLAPEFVDAFPGRLLNVHPSLLPAFPGARAVRDALEAGVKVTGTTVHLVDHEVDHGPILFQEPVPTRPNDTEESLHERIKEAEHRLLVDACRALLGGDVVVKGRVASVMSGGER